MIEMVQYNYITFSYFNKHKTHRAISKEMGIYKESYFYSKIILFNGESYHYRNQRQEIMVHNWVSRVVELSVSNSKRRYFYD